MLMRKSKAFYANTYTKSLTTTEHMPKCIFCGCIYDSCQSVLSRLLLGQGLLACLFLCFVSCYFSLDLLTAGFALCYPCFDQVWTYICCRRLLYLFIV